MQIVRNSFNVCLKHDIVPEKKILKKRVNHNHIEPPSIDTPRIHSRMKSLKFRIESCSMAHTWYTTGSKTSARVPVERLAQAGGFSCRWRAHSSRVRGVFPFLERERAAFESGEKSAGKARKKPECALLTRSGRRRSVFVGLEACLPRGTDTRLRPRVPLLRNRPFEYTAKSTNCDTPW